MCSIGGPSASWTPSWRPFSTQKTTRTSGEKGKRKNRERKRKKEKNKMKGRTKEEKRVA